MSVKKSAVGGIWAELILQIKGGGAVPLGTVHLPLKVTSQTIQGRSDMTLGIGVDLEGFKRDVEAIFTANDISDTEAQDA